MSIAGSIESVTVAGLTLYPTAESDGKFPVGNFEKETLATARGPIVKFKKKVKTIEGNEFDVTPSESELISAISDRIIAYDSTFVLVDGSIYQGRSFIETKERSSMEGKMAIDFIPTEPAGWTQINAT